MKKFLHSLSVRQIILGISGILSFLVFLALLAAFWLLQGKEQSQRMANRWDADGGMAQVSCFFSHDAAISEDMLETFRHSIDSALQEASVTQDSPNASARLWTDAYSADGMITVESDKSKLDAHAIGIGGDFFQFHPLRLLDGSYFSGNDLNSDYCILDEDGAWQLFGSNDVAGMTVMIAGMPHLIAGVVHRDDGYLARAAGLESTIVYVSYSTLERYGTNYGINHYEVVMPNPVRSFAYQYVAEHIGVDEQNLEVVENSKRFKLLERIKAIPAFATRSMNGKAIIYPYWENIARGYEDLLTVIALFGILFLAYPAILLTIYLMIRWKHKTWTVKGVYLHLKDKGERRMEGARAKRRIKRQRKKKYKNRFDEEEEYR